MAMTISGKSHQEKPAVVLKVPQAVLLMCIAAALGIGGGQIPSVLGQGGQTSATSERELESISTTLKAVETKLQKVSDDLTAVRERLGRMEGRAERNERYLKAE
jgi:hypothetical protein